MRTLSLIALLLSTSAFAAAKTAPSPGLSDAAAARAMLRGDIWARLVRIDNANPRGVLSRSAYPKTVYALVFELSGILWFYTASDGTQSLSATLGTVARDEADPGPLFRGIDPGFREWSWVDDRDAPRGSPSLRPPNACFVESVAALLRRMEVGAESASPRLLSYYVETAGGPLGHTVLLFGTSAGLSAIDSESSERPISLPTELGVDPKAISVFLRGGPVSSARTLPIQCPGRSRAPGRWAALPSQPAPAG